MKRLLTLLFVLTVSVQNHSTMACSALPTQSAQENILIGIEKKIENAFAQSMSTKAIAPLETLSIKLDILYRERPNKLVQYWRANAQFFHSIYYKSQEKDEQAETAIDKGIEWMLEMKDKNSEDYALLSRLQGYALQFKGMQVMFLAGAVKEHAKQAIAADQENLRAYLVYATNDYYTPEMFGGGKETEEYLLKALSLPAQKIKNPLLPSWGKTEAYELLIKFYIREENWAQAQKYYEEGIQAFPDNPLITRLATKITAHK